MNYYSILYFIFEIFSSIHKPQIREKLSWEWGFFSYRYILWSISFRFSQIRENNKLFPFLEFRKFLKSLESALAAWKLKKKSMPMAYYVQFLKKKNFVKSHEFFIKMSINSVSGIFWNIFRQIAHAWAEELNFVKFSLKNSWNCTKFCFSNSGLKKFEKS